MKNSGLFLNMAKWCFWVCFLIFLLPSFLFFIVVSASCFFYLFCLLLCFKMLFWFCFFVFLLVVLFVCNHHVGFIFALHLVFLLLLLFFCSSCFPILLCFDFWKPVKNISEKMEIAKTAKMTNAEKRTV